MHTPESKSYFIQWNLRRQMTFNCRQCAYLLLHTISFTRLQSKRPAWFGIFSSYFQQMQISENMRRNQNRRVYHVLCPNRQPHLKINRKCFATEDVGLQLITCHCVSFNWVSLFAHNLIAISLPVLFLAHCSLIYRRRRAFDWRLRQTACKASTQSPSLSVNFNLWIAFLLMHPSFWSNSSWNLVFVIKRDSHWRSIE